MIEFGSFLKNLRTVFSLPNDSVPLQLSTSLECHNKVPQKSSGFYSSTHIVRERALIQELAAGGPKCVKLPQNTLRLTKECSFPPLKLELLIVEFRDFRSDLFNNHPSPPPEFELFMEDCAGCGVWRLSLLYPLPYRLVILAGANVTSKASYADLKFSILF